MSLLTLPDTGYTYLGIEYGATSNFIGEDLTLPNTAQFWVDVVLDEDRFTIAIWWKFWKPAITFKVFACGGTVDPFYRTVRLQLK